MARRKPHPGLRSLGVAVSALLFVGACAGATRQLPPDEAWLAPFVGTPEVVVAEMLRLAAVGPQDMVYDLGSGDGRIIIAAARMFGARGVGLDLDADLVRQSVENARRAGVAHRVEFRLQDVLTADLSPATVVTLYLSPEANLQLRPALQAQLRPGARVVSHDFDMEDWKPEATRRVVDQWGVARTLYLWRIPPPGR